MLLYISSIFSQLPGVHAKCLVSIQFPFSRFQICPITPSRFPHAAPNRGGVGRGLIRSVTNLYENFLGEGVVKIKFLPLSHRNLKLLGNTRSLFLKNIVKNPITIAMVFSCTHITLITINRPHFRFKVQFILTKFVT